MRLDAEDVVFKEEKITDMVTYQFFIYYGAKKDALKFANRLNVFPCVLSEDITKAILSEEMVKDFSNDD